MAERLAFIDAAKAIGISLVVLGHSPGLPNPAVVLIYSFHMPLFFFISGFVQGESRTPASAPVSAAAAIARSARSLLIPYLSFFLISLAYWLATRDLGGRAGKFAGVGVGDALKGLATGLSSDLFVNPALWFLPCLFVCATLHRLLRRRLPALAVLAVAAAWAAAWTVADAWQTRLPWGLDIAWVALIFFAAGSALRGSPWKLEAWPPHAVLIALPLVAMGWIAAAGQLGRVDLAQAQFGSSLGLYLATACLGIAVVLLLGRCVPANPAVRWLADHSLIIFALHALLINLASGALKFMQLGLDRSGDYLWPLLLFAWVMAASLPAARLLTRHFPWLLGRALPKVSP